MSGLYIFGYLEHSYYSLNWNLFISRKQDCDQSLFYSKIRERRTQKLDQRSKGKTARNLVEKNVRRPLFREFNIYSSPTGSLPNVLMLNLAVYCETAHNSCIVALAGCTVYV